MSRGRHGSSEAECASDIRWHPAWVLSTWSLAGQENAGQVFSPLRMLFLVETRKKVSTAPSTSDTLWRVLPLGIESYPFSLELERKNAHLDSLLGRISAGEKSL